MKKSSEPKLGMRQRFRNFIKETFRAREKNEYKEFFTRGMRGRESKAKLEHGWMYVRVFALSFVLFALVAFVIACSRNGIAVPTLYLLGGAFMNLTVAVFIYELNPERNLPFVLFILILVLGAIAADFITMFGYYFFYPENDWISTLWTAVLEEAAKAIPAIVVILIFRKRSPLLGFIIGAAIGAGYSITEDMGYIYAYSYGGVYRMVEISIERACTAVCTHTLWTAVIGWAFCKFKCRPYDLRFLAVALSSIAMHFLWDMPIEVGLHILPTAFCVVAAIVFSALVIKSERKPYRQAAASEVQLIIPVPDERGSAAVKYAKWCSYSANFTAALTAVLVSVALILWCVAPVEYDVISQRFKSEDEFLEFVQGDRQFLAKWDKKFEDCIDDCEINYAVIVDGKYSYAFITVEEEDGYKYDYSFYFYENETTGESVGAVSGIAVTVSPTEYYHLLQLTVPDGSTSEDTGYRRITYAKVAEFSSCYYDTQANEFIVVFGWNEDRTAEIVISAFAGGILLVGAAAFTAFKIKSKKIRRKENVG